VTLHIERKDAAAFDITIVRDTIQRQEVITRDLGDGSVGYVRLTGFSENGADAFVAAIKADVDKGDKKLVVDLRGNPGGFIDAARKVASAFIASGTVFWQEDAKGELMPTDARRTGGDDRRSRPSCSSTRRSARQRDRAGGYGTRRAVAWRASLRRAPSSRIEPQDAGG
jgi:C-terminal processing protease CtpA/Prc